MPKYRRIDLVLDCVIALSFLAFMMSGCGESDSVVDSDTQHMMNASYRRNKAAFDAAATPRKAEGSGGYLDQHESNRRNLDQTGIHDQGVPLDMRRDRARELGYDEPTK